MRKQKQRWSAARRVATSVQSKIVIIICRINQNSKCQHLGTVVRITNPKEIGSPVVTWGGVVEPMVEPVGPAAVTTFSSSLLPDFIMSWTQCSWVALATFSPLICMQQKHLIETWQTTDMFQSKLDSTNNIQTVGTNVLEWCSPYVNLSKDRFLPNYQRCTHVNQLIRWRIAVNNGQQTRSVLTYNS